MKIKCTSCHNYNFKLQNIKRTQFGGGGGGIFKSDLTGN